MPNLATRVLHKLFPSIPRREAERAALQAEVAKTRTALVAAVETINMHRLENSRYDIEDIGGRERLVDRELISEWVEAEMMGGSGVGMERMTTPQREAQAVQIKERMWEIELALEDRGWQRQLALAQTEFSRYGLQQIILMSRLYFIKNPLIRRGVLVSSYYTFGRGVEVTSDDPDVNDAIQNFLNDPGNQKELGQVGLVEKDQALHTDGNLFFVFPTNQGDGTVQVRSIDATEIVDIVTDPDDASIPRYYHRRWIARTFDMATGVSSTTPSECWYPALGYESTATTIGGAPVMKDQPVLHMKCGGLSKWLFGCPEIYNCIDWARAYKHFLEDWASVNRALARFATTVETKGGVQAIQNFQKVLGTTLGVGGTSVETNPTPVTGSAFITGPGNKLEAFKTQGAQNSPEQGRRMMLMVAAGFGLPETFFGDASTGSLATAVSLDRPTELKFLERQERWRQVLQIIVMYAVGQSATRGKGKLREARKAAGKNGDLSDITVTVQFPAVLEHDIAQRVSAIIQAATLGGLQLGGTMDMKTCMLLLLAELGVEDPEAVFDAMYTKNDSGAYDPTNYADNGKADVPETPTDAEGMPTQPKPQPGAHLLAPSFGREALREARLAAAIEQLTVASRKMLARSN